MESVRTRPFRLDPLTASRAMMFVRRKALLRFDLFVGLVAALLLFAVFLPGQPVTQAIQVALIGAAAAVLIGRGLRPLRVAARMRRPDHESLLVSKEAEFDQRGVRWQGQGVASDLEWPHVQRLARTPTHLGIEFAGQIFLIPIEAFPKGDLEKAGALAREAGVKVEELRR